MFETMPKTEGLSMSIYKLNIPKDYRNALNYKMWGDDESEYSPITDGNCFVDDYQFIWEAADDWYAMILEPYPLHEWYYETECSLYDVYSYLYGQIDIDPPEMNPTLIFSNTDIPLQVVC